VEHLTREIGGTILITEATRCLLSGMVRDRTIDFELRPRGDFALKGVSEPVPIYELATPMDESSSDVPKSPQASA
jgi:class 3 adenylate cyclase